jgi:hypothetical protein
LRGRIVEGLERLPVEDEAPTVLLSRWDAEQDGDVKLLGAAAYYRRCRDSFDVDEEVARLLTLVSVTGHDYEARRRAAFAGLVLLDHPDAIADLNEPLRPDHPVRIPLGHNGSGAEGRPFLRLLAEHWSSIEERLGDQLPRRLTSNGREPHAVWSALAEVAADFPAIATRVLDEVERDSAAATESGTLRLAARVRPGHPLLRENCLRALDEARWSGSYAGAVEIWSAVEILAAQFSADTAIRRWLEAREPSLHDDAAIAVRCFCFPDDPRVQELGSLLHEGEWPRVSWMAAGTIEMTATSPENLPDVLERQLRELSVTGTFADYILRPAIARLRVDVAAAEVLGDALRITRAPDLRATVPGLLARVGALDHELQDWCRREIRRLAGVTPMEFGYDLNAGTVRGVSLALRAALDGRAN